jgi:hypothetical protein
VFGDVGVAPHLHFGLLIRQEALKFQAKSLVENQAIYTSFPQQAEIALGQKSQAIPKVGITEPIRH